ncbi:MULTISPECIES: DUF4097 family beta strand repeat-containing protein [Pontibacillus]|uniref:DUF4097 domain-containing protein n=1 Tax=Pontibacillus chungwhensis TaxID=265426 RepID=A0ABY8UXV1_9BACI|nr:DUF4097 domain-containing protein [Pontibacillus chungwhensis]MCD5325865.1 DUF4097 domain-containing protein [Pontibacillus sp. HN14]WIF97576.1 DUF4097 domain-containing protein [Pontibacillus chungwhensis]
MKEERKRILTMLQEGKISTEEAEELIDALDYASEVEEDQDEPVSLSKKVDWNANQGQKAYDSGSTKQRFKSLVGEAFKKIKNVDLDFNFGSYQSVHHIFQHQGVDFQNIYIDVANGNVTMKPWKEADLRLECQAKVYQVNNQDEARERFMDLKNFIVDEKNLRFEVKSKKMKTDVTLWVPEKAYEDVSLRVFNGKIEAEGLPAQDLDMKTSNGDLVVRNMSGREWELSTSNGSITAEQVTCDDLETEMMNGSVTLKGDFGKVDSQVINGNIQCVWEGQRGHTGFFKTTTGNVDLTVEPSLRLNGKMFTNLGSLHCHLPNFKTISEQKETLKKELKFETNPHLDHILHVEAETKTGSVKIYPNEG